MSLFNRGWFKLHSGEETSFLIDCSALTLSDLEALADLAVKNLPAFDHVVAIPNGGVRFAEVLQARKYVWDRDRGSWMERVCPRCGAVVRFDDVASGPIGMPPKTRQVVCRALIVDDVLTTGTSFIEARRNLRQEVRPALLDIFGVCIFARTWPPDWAGDWDWVCPLFVMHGGEK